LLFIAQRSYRHDRHATATAPYENPPSLEAANWLHSRGKRSRKKNTRQLTYFREVKGKIVERVEIDPDLNAIIILFQDKTALSFDLEPRFTVSCRTGKLETGVE
jgi:hypothetical protein